MKVVFFVVEVSKELPRHALVDCLYGLSELAKKDADKKINLKSTRFGLKCKLIRLLFQHFAFVTNIEFWQFVMLEKKEIENQINWSTPKQMFYPEMRNEEEEARWMASGHCEMVKVMYWLIHDKLCTP